MSGVLVLAEPRRGELREVSLELVAAGRGLKDGAGGRLVVVAASSPSSFADQLNVEGVDAISPLRPRWSTSTASRSGSSRS